MVIYRSASPGSLKPKITGSWLNNVFACSPLNTPYKGWQLKIQLNTHAFGIVIETQKNGVRIGIPLGIAISDRLTF